MTFNQLSSNYMESIKQTMRPSSFSNLKYNMDNYVLPAFGELDVSEITKDEILSRIKCLSGKKGIINTRTRQNNLNLVKRIVKTGMEYGFVKPFLLDFSIEAEIIEENKEKKDYLTDEEAQKIIRNIRKEPTPHKIGFLLSLCLGLKIGEICALKWSDFDIDAKTVNIQRALQRVQPVESKTSDIVSQEIAAKSLRRTLYLSENLILILKENFKSRFDKNVLQNNFYVITDKEKPVEPRSYRRNFSSFLTECEIDDLKFGCLKSFYEEKLRQNKPVAEYATITNIF